MSDTHPSQDSNIIQFSRAARLGLSETFRRHATPDYKVVATPQALSAQYTLDEELVEAVLLNRGMVKIHSLIGQGANVNVPVYFTSEDVALPLISVAGKYASAYTFRTVLKHPETDAYALDSLERPVMYHLRTTHTERDAKISFYRAWVEHSIGGPSGNDNRPVIYSDQFNRISVRGERQIFAIAPQDPAPSSPVMDERAARRARLADMLAAQSSFNGPNRGQKFTPD